MERYIEFFKKEYMTIAVFFFVGLQLLGYVSSCSKVVGQQRKLEKFTIECSNLCLPNSSQTVNGSEDLECWCYENETTLRIESLD